MLAFPSTKPSLRSLINWLASLPDSQKTQAIQSLTRAERLELLYAWEGYARPEQILPAGDWRVWLILAGRGWGKTRTGAETVRYLIERGLARRVAIVARTAADARDVMVEGESGLLHCCPPRMGASYEPSKRRVTFRNGALCTTYSADEPNLLRGPQHDFGWADELAAWSYPDAWDQLKLGMRLGRSPRLVATTTPRPLKVIRDLVKDPATVVTRGNTYQNAQWLPASFLEDIRARFEGTRLGRQELMAEVLEDVPGALWVRANLDATRVRVVPPLTRVEIGVDPAVTSGENSDETGIIIAGRGADAHGYVLEDLSCRATPDTWARKVVEAYHRHHANRVVAEVNNGGDLVVSLIRTVDPRVTVLPVRASHGKRARAEPVAALYEQGRVHHLGTHPMLEDQQCMYTPDDFDGSPDHVDALVWVMSSLMLGDAAPTYAGQSPILGSWGRKR